jgi:hypothetical protein
MQYKLTQSGYGVQQTLDDGSLRCIPPDPANRDWQEYQAWLAADPENNVPEAAE